MLRQLEPPPQYLMLEPMHHLKVVYTAGGCSLLSYNYKLGLEAPLPIKITFTSNLGRGKIKFLVANSK